MEVEIKSWEDLPVDATYEDLSRRANCGVINQGRYTNWYFASPIPAIDDTFKSTYWHNKSRVDKAVVQASDYFKINAFFQLNETLHE